MKVYSLSSFGDIFEVCTSPVLPGFKIALEMRNAEIRFSIGTHGTVCMNSNGFTSVDVHFQFVPMCLH